MNDPRVPPTDQQDDQGSDSSSDEGEAAQGTMLVDGAVSKGDGDARMTKKRMNKIMRAASVAVRMMADKGDALIKAVSGNYNTMESDLRQMSGADLNRYISSNPSHMDKTSTTWVQKEMKQSGYNKQLEVLTHGTLEAAQKAVKSEIADAIRGKSLVELDPDQQSFVWDKLAELGLVSGEYENNFGALNSVLGDLAASSPAMKNAMIPKIESAATLSPLQVAFKNAVESLQAAGQATLQYTKKILAPKPPHQ